MVEAEAVDLLVPAAEPPLERPAMSAPRRPRASGSPKSNGRSTRLAARTPPHQTRRSVTPASLDQRTLPPSIMRAHARTRGNPANPPFAAPTLGGAAVPNRQNRPKWAEIRRSPQRETWFLAGARSFANPGRRVRRGEDRRGHRRDQHVLDAARTRLDARPAVLCRRGRQRGPGEYFRPARPDRDRPARHRNRAVTGERPRCASWRSSTLNCPGLRATQWSRPRRSTCWCRAPLQYRARHRAPRRSDRPRAAFCRRGRQRGPGEYFRPARPDRDRPARHRNRAVTVSGPDAARRYNTGLGIEHLDGAIARARLVVAQLNPELPWSEGDTMVEAEAVDLLVP